jgi:cell wall-associated NlpC family hydrolase
MLVSLTAKPLAPLLLLAAAAALTSGCASGPREPTVAAAARPVIGTQPSAPLGARPELSVGGAVAEIAMGMVGARYHYGGADPAHGFDCSGLVFYTYNQAGHPVPRTSAEQFRAARKIAPADAGAGDLMFFQDQAQLSHVGIYLGDGLFVHAPATGREVSVERVDSPYYQHHLVAVGRLLP